MLNEVIWAKDGQEARDYVRREGEYLGCADNGCLVILLNINMPKVDGVEVLRQLKANEKTKKIPVMML